MNFSEHCYLCDNIKTSLDKGITCKLSNEKPNFELTCSKISFNEKLQYRLEKVNLEYKMALNNRKSTLFKFYLFITLGIILLFIGLIFTSFLITLYFSFFCIGGGISILSASFFLLKNFRRKLKISKKEKKDLDKLIELYDMRYDINISFGKNIHGLKEAKIDLILDNKKSNKTYVIS